VVCTGNMGSIVRNSALEGQRLVVGGIGQQGPFWLRALAVAKSLNHYSASIFCEVGFKFKPYFEQTVCSQSVSGCCKITETL